VKSSERKEKLQEKQKYTSTKTAGRRWNKVELHVSHVNNRNIKERQNRESSFVKKQNRRKGDGESYERDKELQDQEQYHGINRTKMVLPRVCLSGRRRMKDEPIVQQLVARGTCQNVETSNRFCKTEEKAKCILHGRNLARCEDRSEIQKISAI
jgi:hypothetical protein